MNETPATATIQHRAEFARIDEMRRVAASRKRLVAAAGTNGDGGRRRSLRENARRLALGGGTRDD
jgi:hypothetical protein